jgi:hypothetical protein
LLHKRSALDLLATHLYERTAGPLAACHEALLAKLRKGSQHTFMRLDSHANDKRPTTAFVITIEPA